ncbi:MAG: NADH-quinone oxidoreductase subunit A [Deltaproteobacteria bacterium]|nr:NADH-quinone oxidoreductase subunit A [Deltaproteobacteria bacterium]
MKGEVVPKSTRSRALEIPQALSDFWFVLVFLVAAGLFATGPLIIAKLIAPRSFGAARSATYECGMPTIGSAWIQVSVIYYLFALLFLAFDVDVLFLLPVLLAYNKGYVWRDFIEITIFIGILSLVIVYAWRRGVFSWKRKPANP